MYRHAHHIHTYMYMCMYVYVYVDTNMKETFDRELQEEINQPVVENLKKYF